MAKARGEMPSKMPSKMPWQDAVARGRGEGSWRGVVARGRGEGPWAWTPVSDLYLEHGGVHLLVDEEKLVGEGQPKGGVDEDVGDGEEAGDL